MPRNAPALWAWPAHPGAVDGRPRADCEITPRPLHLLRLGLPKAKQTN
jgi:hypothetical protein